MKHVSWFVGLIGLIGPSVIAGCAGDQALAPQTTPSSSSVGYALEWPARLDSIGEHYRQGLKQAQSDAKSLPSFPGNLSEDVPELTRELYKLADEAGRSHVVVEHLRSSQKIQAFVEDHDKAMAWRIGAHVNAALKRDGCACEYEVGPATMNAIKGAVEDQLDDRYRELNEAHRLLELRSDELNKRDVEAVEDHIDTITKTSFFVYVDSIDLLLEIDRLLAELEDVQQTIDAAIAEERRAVNNPDASKAQTKAATERLEALQSAKTPLGGAVNKTQVLREQMEENIEQLKMTYETSLEQLLGEPQSDSDAAQPQT